MTTTLFGPAGITTKTTEDAIRLCLYDGPLELSWKHCAMTSDLISDMMALRYRSSGAIYNQVRHNVGYLANELLENAVKFRAPGKITVDVILETESFWIKVSNLVDGETADRFQHLLSRINVKKPGELLIEQIEANAADDFGKRSGLGLLTLMSDYEAHLAWSFAATESSGQKHLDTYALLAVPSLQNS